ncbi:MAG: flagellin [Methanoregula sp.]|nr:flagellin [Methanoregula sp.]
MSAETITTAIFLITAVVATAVLVNAIYPVIYSTAGTFQSSTHDADTRLRTDFKIVATFAHPDPTNTVDIYMKNIGSQRISTAEIENANVFCGKTVGNLLTYGIWTYEIVPPSAAADNYWDTGETLHITATTSIDAGKTVYFQFVLPNGIWRSQEFNAELS